MDYSILFKQSIDRDDWAVLLSMYKKEFGKDFNGNCMCNAPKVQEILKKKKGYAQQDSDS